MSQFTISSGRCFPLGATFVSSTNASETTGTNFALFSAHAEKVELCLFDESGQNEIQRIILPEYTDDVFHGFVENLPVGSLYGYRVYGPFEPHKGHSFNPAKLLLDPYAKALQGEVKNSPLHYSYQQNTEQQSEQQQKSLQQDLTLDLRDNAKDVAKCVVIDTTLTTPCTSHPRVRQRDSIIYEMHVKGFTAQQPNIPIELKGTFAGLTQKSTIDYLGELGITSIELMTVHQFLNEAFV